MSTAGSRSQRGSDEDGKAPWNPNGPEFQDRVPPGAGIPSQVGASPATGWWQRTFASLRNRDYRIFFAGQTVSLVGTWMRMTAQGWLVYELTGSKFLLGTVTGLSLLPVFLFSTVAGAVADRMSKRRLLIGAQAAMMLVSLSVAFLVATGEIQVWHLVLAATLIGTAFAVDLPTRQAYYIQLVGRRDLLNAIALNSAAFNAARIVGPAVAGVLMAALGIAACFFADAVSYLAVIGSLLLIRTREHVPPSDGKSHLQLVREGFAYVRETRRVKTLMLLLAVTGIFGWSYVALMPAYAQDVLSLSEAGYGALMSANGLGALAGALFVAGRGEKRDPRRQVFGGLWLFCLTLLGFAVVGHPLAAGAFIALSGAGLITFLSTSNTLIQLTVPDELRGRVMGVWGLVFGGALPVGSFLMGAVAQRFGVVVAMASGALVCLGASVLVYLKLPARSREEAS
jgi:predicted MFS family arabinose efflux permease